VTGAAHRQPRLGGDQSVGRRVLVVLPARHLAMDAQRRARAVAALTALLIPYTRDELAASAGRLDSTAPVEPSLDPIDR